MEFDSFVLAAVTADLADEPAARGLADAIELRMDLASSPLEQLQSYDGELPVIATNRVDTEGGAAADTAARVETLASAAGTPAVGAVDIELAALGSAMTNELLAITDSNDVACIVSAHDFEATPSREDMASTLRAACDSGDIGKLAVTATGLEDVLALLDVTHELTGAGLTVSSMAMGRPGQHSRAVAPLYGSRLGYAPVSTAEETAPGQYDLATLRSLVETLGVR